MLRHFLPLFLFGSLAAPTCAQTGFEPLDPHLRNVRGVNYVPTYPTLDGSPGWYGVASHTAMWSRFDATTIPDVKEQLTWAKRCGFNTIRVFLSYLCWQFHDGKASAKPNQFLADWDLFLSICEAQHLRVIPVLWDFVSLSEPYGEPDFDAPDRLQSPANSSFWHDSPGRKRAYDACERPLAEQDLGRFVVECVRVVDRHDPQLLLAWDVANEPYLANDPDLAPRSRSFVQQTMRLVKATRPQDRVLFSGAVADRWPTTLAWAQDPDCDAIGIHVYGPNSPAALRAMLYDATFVTAPDRALGKPVLATEIGYPGAGFSYQDTVRYCQLVPRPDLPTPGAVGVGFCTWMLMIGHTDSRPGSRTSDHHPFKHGTGLFYGHVEDGRIHVRDLAAVQSFVDLAIAHGIDKRQLWFADDPSLPELVEMPASHPFFVDPRQEGGVGSLLSQQWLQVLLMQAPRAVYRQPGTTWELYCEITAMFRGMIHPYLDLKQMVSERNGNPVQRSTAPWHNLDAATRQQLQWLHGASDPGTAEFAAVIAQLEQEYGIAAGGLRPWDPRSGHQQRDLAILFGDLVYAFAQQMAPLMLWR